MDIIRSKGELYPKATRFSFRENQNRIGDIEFKPSNWFRPLALLWVGTNHNLWDMGYSTLMIRRFIEEVGHSNLITSEIVHDDSLGKLRELQILDLVYNQGKLRISDQHTLSQIPIVHILQSGGIQVIQLDMKYNRNKGYKDKIKSIKRIYELVDTEERVLEEYFIATLKAIM